VFVEGSLCRGTMASPRLPRSMYTCGDAWRARAPIMGVWDGTPAEFRGRALFRGSGGCEKKLSHYCHGVRFIWNFFATSHWKGPVDGVGEH